MSKNLKGKKVVKDTILILGAGIYARPFYKHGKVILVSGITSPDEYPWNKIKGVVFTGGVDVDPSLYNEKIHSKTHSNIRRDKSEKLFYNRCKDLKIPTVGICRGAQFLNVMNGGRLMQHVYNHAISGTHTIITDKDESVFVTSTHHQMMYPKGKYQLLAWANGLSNKYETGGGVIFPKSNGEVFREPEVVYFPDTKSLSVQFHPEYMKDDSRGYSYFQDLLKEYFL